MEVQPVQEPRHSPGNENGTYSVGGYGFTNNHGRDRQGWKMKLFKKMRDGGPESPVVGYFLVEIKSLFSVVLLHFGGTREAFHSHAFNAVTLWLRGRVEELVKTPEGDKV